jgi:dihydroxyacetone kinase-like protein
MVDVWGPAIDALATSRHEGAELPAALAACVTAAERGRDATIPMQARKGRASYLGPRSAGHMDPGAASSAILLAALRDVVCDSAAPAQHSDDGSV